MLLVVYAFSAIAQPRVGNPIRYGNNLALSVRKPWRRAIFTANSLSLKSEAALDFWLRRFGTILKLVGHPD